MGAKHAQLAPRRAGHVESAGAARFREAVEESGFDFDEAQRAAIDALCRPVRHGHYLWGGVGRGKSLICDLLFASIPTSRKRRFHFHDFFRDLHAQITVERAPIDRSLRRLVSNATVVLFDEFHVHDVADGVYLSATLRSLLDRGVFVIATSNVMPEQLMPNPLYHDRFVPTIEIIRSQLDVVHLGDGRDYRREAAGPSLGLSAGSWHPRPIVVPGSTEIKLDVAGQVIAACVANDTLVVTFQELCERNLGAAQYLRLAEQFRVIVLTSVPDLATVDRDPLARFAAFIDVVIDRAIELHVSAVGLPERLLEAANPPRDASRLISRLALLRGA